MFSRLFQRGLRTKIIGWSFVPTALILLLVAGTILIAYTQVTDELIINRDRELTRLSANELSSGFEEYVDRLSVLARLPEVYSDEVALRQEALGNEENRLVFFDGGVYLLNNQGVVTTTSQKNKNALGQDWSDRTYFTKMVRTPEPVFSNIEIGPDGIDVIVFAVPIISDKDEFKGVAVGMFKMDATAVSPFYGTLVRLRIGRMGRAYIIDGSSRIVFASDFNLIGSPFGDYPVLDQINSDQVNAVHVTTSDGRDILTGFAPVPRSDWHLIVEENWSDVLAATNQYGGLLFMFLILGLVIPTIVTAIGVRRITGPIKNIMDAARSIAGGDFKQRIQVKTGDELEDLSDQFNAMAGQLDESYTQLETRVRERTRELSALYAIAYTLSRSLDLNRILPDALAKTIEVMEMDAGVIFILQDEILQVAAEMGVSYEFRSLVDGLPLSQSIVQEVANSRMVIARLVADYPPGVIREALMREGYQLVVSIPIIYHGNVLGAININSRKNEMASKDELAVAAAIGQQIGIAMENARLFRETQVARDQQRKFLQTFTTNEVVEELMEKGFSLGGKEINATTMFVDIRNFTTLTESQHPMETIDLLNKYYGLAFTAIRNRGGIVNQIQGDGFLALFGAPVPQPDHQERAVRAALDLLGFLEKFNEQQVLLNRTSVRIGIGIASGQMVAGYTGTEERATYTCLGDPVNLASRLQDHTKQVQTPLLMDENTFKALPADLQVEPLGLQLFKGKAQAVNIYTIRLQ